MFADYPTPSHPRVLPPLPASSSSSSFATYGDADLVEKRAAVKQGLKVFLNVMARFFQSDAFADKLADVAAGPLDEQAKLGAQIRRRYMEKLKADRHEDDQVKMAINVFNVISPMIEASAPIFLTDDMVKCRGIQTDKLPAFAILHDEKMSPLAGHLVQSLRMDKLKQLVQERFSLDIVFAANSTSQKPAFDISWQNAHALQWDRDEDLLAQLTEQLSSVQL